MLKEAALYDKLPNGRVRCNTCPRHCRLGEGKRGYCFTRQNQQGKFYSLIYYLRAGGFYIGKSDREKPIFHFYPRSRWLSLGSLGCNFRCPGCQNWEISALSTTKPSRRSGVVYIAHLRTRTARIATGNLRRGINPPPGRERRR